VNQLNFTKTALYSFRNIKASHSKLGNLVVIPNIEEKLTKSWIPLY